MNLRDLEYLVALSEHQHFRKAAEACFVSQPTLSGQIKKLEQELGSPLLERSSRKVLFTEVGQQLVGQARTILGEIQRFKEMATTQGDAMSGPIQIGFIPTVGPYLLPKIVSGLKAQFPQLELYLHEAQTHVLVKQLQEGKLDCVVLAQVEETEPFRELDLFDEPLVLAVPDSHPWSERNAIDMQELNGMTVLALGEGHCLRDQALGYCFAAGAEDDQRFKATSLETLRNMVAAQGGITLLPQLAVPESKTKDGVSYLHAQSPVPSRKIVLAYRPGSPFKPKFDQLAETIRELVSL